MKGERARLIHDLESHAFLQNKGGVCFCDVWSETAERECLKGIQQQGEINSRRNVPQASRLVQGPKNLLSVAGPH